LSTIVNADRIIVLNEGRVVQEGDYESLRSEDGTFRRLIERQQSTPSGSSVVSTRPNP